MADPDRTMAAAMVLLMLGLGVTVSDGDEIREDSEEEDDWGDLDPHDYDPLEDPDLGVSDDNWACGTLEVDS